MIVLIVLVSMIPYYLALDLPKQIVNGPLQGVGFETPDATQLFMRVSVSLPLVGDVLLFPGIPLERLPSLWALSLTFLALVIVNGLFKYFINTRKGRLGERLLRRIRYELIDRILRFPPARFRQMKSGEVSSMVKDEIEPLGGFASDAFTQPVMLGGQALTALLFIFMQHFWLGMVAAGMAAIQVAIIPRMRQRLIILGRQRQLTARELAGRVAEVVDGIQTIHASDATNWERADMVSRLGRIFRIRYDIYQWKFMVKFVNNFLAQLTPFFFYSIGGYLTIQGALDVGQLIAVINAYKELPGPLKELIDWDLARQDMQVKYEQVVEQFASDNLIDPARQAPDAEVMAESFAPLQVEKLTVDNEIGAHLLDNVSFSVAQGEVVALTGGSADGAAALGEVLGGVIGASRGRIMAGDVDLALAPEWVTGRVLGYVGPTPWLLSGSVLDNLTYGLRRRPGNLPEEGAQAREARIWARAEAEKAGNPLYDRDADWIDHDSLQPGGDGVSLLDPVWTVLGVVDLRNDVIGFGTRARASAAQAAELGPHVLALRSALQQRLKERDLASLILPFEADRYNSGATVAENLFFGAAENPAAAIEAVVATPVFRKTQQEIGLDRALYEMGWRFARMTVDLFSGMQDMMPGLSQSLTYMTPDELPEYEVLLDRVAQDGYAAAGRADREKLVRLAAAYVEPTFRFGLLDDALRDLIVTGRRMLAERMQGKFGDLIQPYDRDRFMKGATIIENIVFGKINRRFGRAEERVEEVVAQLLRDYLDRVPALRDGILSMGLARDVGPGGRRISLLQRQKLALARVLIRRSSWYVLNEPLAGVDPAQQGRLIAQILTFLRERPERPGVLWMLANSAFAEDFDRVLAFENGQLQPEPPAARAAG